MRVFVFTWDRYNTLTTPQLLADEGIEHTVLVHTTSKAQRFAAAGRVDTSCIHVTGVPKGLAYARNAALDLMDTGEWAVWLVDDLLSVTELESYDEHALSGMLPITQENQAQWRPTFKCQVPLRQFMHRCLDAATYADHLGANLVGFAGFDNVLFRAKRWKLNTLADGRAWVVRKTHLRFDENVQMVDDVCWTAQNILEFGAVLVDQWVLPKCKRYTAGAFGSIEERLEQKRKEVSYLVATYPQVCAVKAKPGWPWGTHVVIRRTAA